MPPKMYEELLCDMPQASESPMPPPAPTVVTTQPTAGATALMEAACFTEVDSDLSKQNERSCEYDGKDMTAIIKLLDFLDSRLKSVGNLGVYSWVVNFFLYSCLIFLRYISIIFFSCLKDALSHFEVYNTVIILAYIFFSSLVIWTWILYKHKTYLGEMSFSGIAQGGLQFLCFRYIFVVSNNRKTRYFETDWLMINVKTVLIITQTQTHNCYTLKRWSLQKVLLWIDE